MNVIICQMKWKTQLDSVTIFSANPCSLFLSLNGTFFSFLANWKAEDKLVNNFAIFVKFWLSGIFEEQIRKLSLELFFIDSRRTSVHKTWEQCQHKSSELFVKKNISNIISCTVKSKLMARMTKEIKVFIVVSVQQKEEKTREKRERDQN